MDSTKHNFESYKIDIRKAFAYKNPRMAKLLPGFIFRLIERIVHQEEMNYIYRTGFDLDGLGFIDHGLHNLQARIKVYNEENIPKSGRYIFVANHPLGGLDGMVFAKIIGKHFPNLKFIVNDLLLLVKPFEDIFQPVNKHGRQSVENVRAIESIYASNAQILTFPAGICSRKIKKQIMDLPWTKSFVIKAVQHKRDIVPVYFKGRNSAFFYNLANFRSAIGIKTNIEMFLLPHEMVMQRDKEISMTIGKAIPYTLFDKSKKPDKWANWVKEEVYKLAE
jgi:putative hemolysin